MLLPAAQDPSLWAPLTFSPSRDCVSEPLNCPGSLGFFEHTPSLSEPSPASALPCSDAFFLLSQKVDLISWACDCLSLTILALVWEPVLSLLQSEFQEEQGPQLP